MKNLTKKEVNFSQFIGFTFVSVLGTILHFLFKLTGENKLFALFSSVNESTWEHMKILFFPLLLYALLQSFFLGKSYENFWCVKCKGILYGVSAVPVIFYTLQGVFGGTPDWVNISIFFLASAISFSWESKNFQRGSEPCRWKIGAILLLCAVAVAFFLLTFFPFQIPLFQDPIYGYFGIK